MSTDQIIGTNVHELMWRRKIKTLWQSCYPCLTAGFRGIASWLCPTCREAWPLP